MLEWKHNIPTCVLSCNKTWVVVELLEIKFEFLRISTPTHVLLHDKTHLGIFYFLNKTSVGVEMRGNSKHEADGRVI